MSSIEMVRRILKEYRPQKLPKKDYIQASVLVPLFVKDGEEYLLFTKRTDKVAHHKAQISFPGGAREPEDESILQTALRETEEEIGLKRSDVEIIGALDENITVGSNFLITPFVGIFPFPYAIKPDPIEIDKILYIPLRSFLDEDDFWVEYVNWEGERVPVYYYRYEGNIVWGATGRIVKGFCEIIEEVEGSN